MFYAVKTAFRTILVATMIPFAHAGTDADGGAWLMSTVSGKLDGPLLTHYGVDAHARDFDRRGGINQYLFRPYIGHRFNDKLSLELGVTRVITDPANGKRAHENRLWQQLSVNAGRALGGNVSLRFRLAERRRSSGDDTAVTLRGLVKLKRPFNADTALAVGFESFVELTDTDWGVDTGLSQARATIGVEHSFSPRFSAEVGYMNQWIDGGANDLINHVGYLNLRFKP